MQSLISFPIIDRQRGANCDRHWRVRGESWFHCSKDSIAKVSHGAWEISGRLAESCNVWKDRAQFCLLCHPCKKLVTMQFHHCSTESCRGPGSTHCLRW